MAPGYAGLPLLLGTTIRRSAVLGRIYLAVAIGYSAVLGLVLALESPSGFLGVFPFFVPIFSAVGAMGALMVFTNDRLKGVFEYLVAYGVSPLRLFSNVLLASLCLASVVLLGGLGVGIIGYLALGHPLTLPFEQAVLSYTIPMSYACVAFSGMLGMYWTSLTTPRSGLNSPIGVIPIIGIAPALVTLITLVDLAGKANVPAIDVIAAAVGIVSIVVIALLASVRRLLPVERMLSPA